MKVSRYAALGLGASHRGKTNTNILRSLKLEMAKHHWLLIGTLENSSVSALGGPKGLRPLAPLAKLALALLAPLAPLAPLEVQDSGMTPLSTTSYN